MRPVTDLTKRVSDIGQQAAAAHAYTTYGADHGVGGNGRAQGTNQCQRGPGSEGKVAERGWSIRLDWLSQCAFDSPSS